MGEPAAASNGGERVIMFAQAVARRLSRAGVHYGWAIVAVIPLMSITTLERAGVAYGWIYNSHVFGAAVAIWAGGFLRSTFETYLPALYGAGFARLAAAASISLIGGRQGAHERLVEAAA
jgi:hypothetical protein